MKFGKYSSTYSAMYWEKDLVTLPIDKLSVDTSCGQNAVKTICTEANKISIRSTNALAQSPVL